MDVIELDIYDIFYSICLGLFIGGIIMSIISMILAEMSAHDSISDHVDKDFGHVDHFDHVDKDFGHVDHFDHVDKDFGHVDHFDHVDKDFGHVDHFDHVDKDFGHIDHDSGYIDSQNEMTDSNIFDDTNPAPFMLLLSTSLLFFGIIGMITSYVAIEMLKFLTFLITPIITFLITKSISIGWRKMAKSRYYQISSTKNLIGKEGEVVLNVDERGGVIKVSSETPLKFEKLHVKPLNPESKFDEGTKVYIVDVRQGYLLVDNNKKLIKDKKK